MIGPARAQRRENARLERIAAEKAVVSAARCCLHWRAPAGLETLGEMLNEAVAKLEKAQSAENRVIDETTREATEDLKARGAVK